MHSIHSIDYHFVIVFQNFHSLSYCHSHYNLLSNYLLDGGGNDSKCNANDNNGEYDYNQLLLKIKELTLEKDNMETDFGRKRAKFKDLFLQKEGLFYLNLFFLFLRFLPAFFCT